MPNLSPEMAITCKVVHISADPIISHTSYWSDYLSYSFLYFVMHEEQSQKLTGNKNDLQTEPPAQ